MKTTPPCISERIFASAEKSRTMIAHTCKTLQRSEVNRKRECKSEVKGTERECKKETVAHTVDLRHLPAMCTYFRVTRPTLLSTTSPPNPAQYMVPPNN